MTRKNRIVHFHIVSLFPEIIDAYASCSILKKAQEKNRIRVHTYQLRKWAEGKHRKLDDIPYGGGAGMILMAPPILRAVDAIKKKNKGRVVCILFSAKGKKLTQNIAQSFSRRYDHFIIICGRYEGVDERVKRALRAREISIGYYVLTDGDAAAVVLISTISRLIPGVICRESLKEESFHGGVEEGEYPQYTRPESLFYKGKKFRVPRLLQSGNHKKIASWRLSHRRKSR